MNAELDLVRDSVRRFARDAIASSLDALAHYPLTGLPEGMVPGLKDLGLLDLSDADAATLGVALEAIAEVGAAPAGIVLANAFGRSVVRATRPELSEHNGHAAGLCAYPIYAEPGVVDRAPTLTRLGDELALDGVAELVVNAPVAGLLVLPVKTTDGDAVVAVDARSNGVSIGPPLLTLGLRGAPTADVTLSGVRISSDRLLSSSPQVLLRDVARRLRGSAVAISAGILRCSLSTAVQYAKDRYQGGQQIIEHQEVRRLIAQMAEDDAYCHEAAGLLSGNDGPEHRHLALFIRAKERAAHATCDGVQLLGGYGYMEDFPQERCMRDAKQAQCLFGRVDHARQELTAALVAEVSA